MITSAAVRAPAEGELRARPPASIVPLAGLPVVGVVLGCKPEPDGALIARLMRRFVYTSGITGLMQVGTLIIMTRLAT